MQHAGDANGHESPNDSLLIYFVASVVRVQLSYPPEQDSFFTHLEESH